MKIFVDTNVLISALAAEGLCSELLEELLVRSDTALYDGWFVFVSDRVLAECASKVGRKVLVPEDRVRSKFDRLLTWARVAMPTHTPLPCPDPGDGWLLAEAVQAGCEYFVTGDRALLQMYAAEGMRIVSPREVMDFLFTGKPIPRFDAHEERATYLAARMLAVA